MTAASHSSSSRFTFDSALPLSGPDGSAVFSFLEVSADALSFFCAVASFFDAAEEVAGDADADGDALVSGVGVEVAASTLAEAVSCGVAGGLSSWANAEVTKINTTMAQSDVNNFISIFFPNLWIL